MFLKLRASEMKISAYVVVIGFAIISLCQITYSADDLDSGKKANITWTRKSAHYEGKDYYATLNFLNEKGNNTDLDGVIEGDSVRFVCSYDPSNIILHQSSTYNFIRFDLGVYVQQGKEQVFALKNVTLEDVGRYECEVNGQIGILRSEILIMNVKPKYPKKRKDAADVERLESNLSCGNVSGYSALIKIVPQENQYSFRDIVIGSNLVFQCHICWPESTNSNQSINFLHNDTRIIPDEKNVFIVNNNTRLIIKRINKTASGKYSCEFFNGTELVPSIQHYNLTIHDKPPRCLGGPWNATLKQPGGWINFTLNSFTDVLFTCEIAPNDAIILGRKWFRSKTELLLNPTAGVELIDSNLYLKRITNAVDGTYTCEIEIEAGRLCSNEISFSLAKLNKEKVPKEKKWYEEWKKSEDSRQKSGSAGRNKTVKPKLHVKLGDELKIKQIYELDNVYLTCSVEPNTTVIHKFTWFQDGRILLSNKKLGIDSESSTLKLNRISKKSIGKYICQGQVIEDLIYVLYSDPFLLPFVKDVTNLPCQKSSDALRSSIQLIGPTNADQFSKVSLSCDVQSSKTILTRRWFRNARKMSENEKPGIHFNGSALQFTSIEKPSQAEYICQVETDSDIVLYSNPLNLTVHEKEYAPRNEKEKVELVVQLGYSLELYDIRETDDIYFTCLLKPKIIDYRRVIWFHEASRIQRSKKPFIEYGNSTLILKDIRENQSGRYYCRAETDAGYVISNWVDIHVKPKSSDPRTDKSPLVPHAILMEAVNGTIPGRVIEFDDVYLIFYIVSDLITDNYTFDWSHNQTELRRKRESSNKVIILRHYRRFTLIILRIDQSFSGAFTGHSAFYDFVGGLHHRESNAVDIGDVREFVTNVPPTVRATFRDTEVNGIIKEFHSAFFTCYINPYEMNILRVSWFLDNTFIDTERRPGEFYNFRVLEGGTIMVLTRASYKSDGKYRCEVETYLGQIVRSNDVKISIELSNGKITLSAVENPIALAHLNTRPQWIYENRNITSLTCYVYPLQYESQYTMSKWLFNGVPLHDTATIYEYIFERNVGFMQLRIHNITKLLIGNYTCTIRLANGTQIESYPAQLLKVNDKPNRQEVYSYPDRQIVIAELQNDPEDIYVNDTVHFYCVIKSDVEVTMFRWYYNLTDSNDSYNVTDLEKHRIDPGNGTYFSSDNRILTLRQVQNTNTTVGNYTCEAETYLGIYISKPTQLSKFKDKPEYDRDYWSKGNVELFVETVDLELNFIHETDDIALACIVKPESTVVFEIEWRRNNGTIFPSERTLYDNQTLIIRNIDNSFVGNYTCHANTKKGYYNSKPLPLVVKKCINLTAEIQDNFESDFYEEDSLYIYCNIKPSTTRYRQVYWHHNGFKLVELLPVYTLGNFGEIIQIRNLRKSSVGSYTCLVETLENITYRSFPEQLSAIEEDENHCNPWCADTPFQKLQLLDEKMKLSEIYEGMNVWLYCDVKPESTFILSVEWYHNGSLFPYKNGIRDFYFQYGSNWQMVRLVNVTLNYSGSYACKVNSKKGEVQPSKDPQFILQVKPKPT